MIRKVGWCGFALLVASRLMAAAAPAPAPGVVQQDPDGQWKVDWSNGYIEASGVGPVQERLPASVRRSAQRRVALVDAYRNLLEATNGVNVTSETTVKMYELVSDDIRTRVEGVVKGYRVVREGNNRDGDYEVVIAIGIQPQPNQASSLATTLVPEVAPNETKAVEHRKDAAPQLPPPNVPPKIEVPPTPPPPAAPLPARKPGPYSGLVIDASGFDLQPCMCPKIMRKDGVEVWGTMQVTREFVQETGIAGFLPTVDQATQPGTRCGDNPLIVRAIGRHGTVWANAVVSDQDAELIQAENAKSKFLDRFKVIFVVGGKR